MTRPRLVRALESAARAALIVYPAPFRARYGADLTDVFVDLCLVRSRGRTGALLVTGGRALLGILRGGLGERFGRSPRTRYRLPRGRDGRPGGSLVNGFLQDVKFAFRSLSKRPAFTALVIGMLALGVAANAAIFSGLNSVVLRPMPFPEPDRLVQLDEIAPRWGLESVSISYPDFHHWNQDNRTFESMAVYDPTSFNLAVEGRPDRVEGALVHWQLLNVLGLQPALGRDFREGDWAEGAPLVAMVSERFWRERLGGTSEAIGATVRLNSQPYSVIGVFPEEAVIPQNVEIWTMLSTLSFCCELDQNRGSWWLAGIGRLAPGVTVDQALEDLRAIHAGLVEEYGNAREVATPRIDPLHELLIADSGPMLLLLFAAVGILLLIACANIGGLMLARAASRGREMGIRTALGAGRGRIIRQLLTESLILSVAGGGIGIVLGHLAMRQIHRAMPVQAAGWVRIEADWRFFAFAVGVSALTAVLFGLAPALYASRNSPRGALEEGAVRGSASRGRRRALGLLVVTEVALAVVLLVGAGLLVGSFRALAQRDLGFRLDPVTYSMVLPESTYAEEQDRDAFWQRVVDRTSTLPGVERAGLVTLRPLAGHTGYFFGVEDGIELPPDEPSPVVLTRFATPAYFDAMGLTFLRGGPYEEHADLEEGEPFGVVVNETFARTFWNGLDVVGKTIRTGGDDEPWLPVVGVVRDTLHYGPDRPMRPGVFLPFWAFDAPNFAAVAMRTAAGRDARDLIPPAREMLRELDSDLPIFAIGTMAEHLSEYLWPQRIYAGLLAAFALAALLLALGGIYSTLSYTVSERRMEIGIRMALGARRGQVLREVVRSGMVVAAIGLVLGLALAWAAAGMAATLLQGASPRDPFLYAGVAVLLLGAALLANVFPARRAAGTEPVTAMRSD